MYVIITLRHANACIVTLTGATQSLGGSEPRSGRRARALPNLERCGSKLFVHGSFEKMALVIEGAVGRRMDGEEALRRARWLEPLLFALPPPNRLMRALGSVVGPQTAVVFCYKAYSSEG